MSKLNSHSISHHLHSTEFGRTIYCFEEVGSTNDVAAEIARNGAPHGTVVTAECQTKGRGRLERIWVSPPGENLYISFILRPDISAERLPFITFVCSIALFETLSELGVEASIKWPNDLIVGDKKAAGILAEMELDGDEVSTVILGVGVNINMTRKELDEFLGDISNSSTSVSESVGRKVDRALFTASLIDNLEKWYLRFMNKGPEHISMEWTKRSMMVGRRVSITTPEDSFEGVAKGIDGDGHLMVERADGATERIIAGDVHLV